MDHRAGADAIAPGIYADCFDFLLSAAMGQ